MTIQEIEKILTPAEIKKIKSESSKEFTSEQLEIIKNSL